MLKWTVMAHNQLFMKRAAQLNKLMSIVVLVFYNLHPAI